MPAVGVDSSCSYRREARRLRGRLHERPQELYGSLRQLAGQYDALYLPAADEPRTPVKHFSEMVAAQLRNGVLSYSRRLSLLKTAGKVGIGRFEANLIIAAVQHRMGRAVVKVAQNRARSFSTSPRVSGLAAFLIVQSMILSLAWLLFAR